MTGQLRLIRGTLATRSAVSLGSPGAIEFSSLLDFTLTVLHTVSKVPTNLCLVVRPKPLIQVVKLEQMLSVTAVIKPLRGP